MTVYFATELDTATETAEQTRTLPLYHVILLDDDDHTYDYVIEMICDLFRYTPERAYELARTVDRDGRVILETCPLERAELKRDQILGYGADPRIPTCKGAMNAVIERAG